MHTPLLKRLNRFGDVVNPPTQNRVRSGYDVRHKGNAQHGSGCVKHQGKGQFLADRRQPQSVAVKGFCPIWIYYADKRGEF